ncbi:MAG: ATP-binding cassette domain-containing protein [Bilophila wadsworthia]
MEIDAGRIDDKPALYSGEWQRLQIARNLVTSPRLVFMDEPTGGLDVRTGPSARPLAPSRAGHGSGGHPRHPRSRRGRLLAPAHGHVPGRSWKRGSPIRCSTIRITPTRNSSSLPSCKGKP